MQDGFKDWEHKSIEGSKKLGKVIGYKKSFRLLPNLSTNTLDNPVNRCTNLYACSAACLTRCTNTCERCIICPQTLDSENHPFPMDTVVLN
jgi:hypothetical protein